MSTSSVGEESHMMNILKTHNEEIGEEAITI